MFILEGSNGVVCSSACGFLPVKGKRKVYERCREANGTKSNLSEPLCQGLQRFDDSMCRVPQLPFKDFLLPEVPSFLWLAHGLWPSVWSSPHIWPAGQPSDLYLPNTSSLRNCSARFLAELWLLHNLSVMGVPALWPTNFKIDEPCDDKQWLPTG